SGQTSFQKGFLYFASCQDSGFVVRLTATAMPPSRNRHSAQRVFTWDKIKMALAAAEEGFYIWNIKTGVIHYTDRCLTMMG
ncbi:hypothetical protein LJB63_26215, partial [[Eubacterium] rectale]|nr:hypothetical protein [Agathobacter rectalis]